MIFFDRWTIEHLQMDVLPLSQLWVQLQNFPTLFSDETTGDIQNWISMLRDESYVWYVVKEKGQDSVIGILYFQLQGEKAEGHLAFFDRRPAEKKELVKFFCRFLFESLPELNKITASVPALYHATWRLVKNVGFKWEGTLREDVRIGGRRIDVHLYGMLRSEAYGLSQGQSQGDQLNSYRHQGTTLTDRGAVPARPER